MSFIITRHLQEHPKQIYPLAYSTRKGAQISARRWAAHLAQQHAAIVVSHKKPNGATDYIILSTDTVGYEVLGHVEVTKEHNA